MTWRGERLGAYRLIATTAVACALLLACSDSHGPKAGSSGSNWLKCEKLADCAPATQAVACSVEGFCLDDEGERIADDDEPAPDPRDAKMVDGADARPRGPSAPCIWGSNALLAVAGVEAMERKNCGRYPSFDASGVLGGFACVDDAVKQERAVELSVNTCVDCYVLMTYVATARRGLFVIRRERDSFGGDGVAEVSLQACDGLGIEEGENPSVICINPFDRYRCSEPADAVPDEEPAIPVEPLKLGDVSAAGNVARETLNLHVNNQAFTTQSVDIDVYIDDQHVLTGDFDVGGPRDWFETAIQVPRGTHMLQIRSVGADIDLEQSIDVPAERWASIDYWNEPPEEPHFTFRLHDAPVSSE